MTIVVSGSEGFVGQLTCELLESNGHSVIRLDIKNGIDLCSRHSLDQIPRFEVFIHLANLLYVPDSYLYPELFYRTNYISTLNALELCRKYKARLIYLSSYIYGVPKYLPIDEEHPISPFNPYAQTKVICEMLCKGYNRDFGTPITILRPFNIYGKGQKGKLLLPEIFSQLKEENSIVHLKSPFPKRDYVNVVDVSRAINDCIIDTSHFNIYNVCSGQSISIREITQIINLNLQRQVEFLFSDSDRVMEVDETKGCFKRIENALGWKPTISFERGIQEIIEFERL